MNALGRLKMLYQRPYISNTLGGTPLAACGFGARDSPTPPPPPHKSNLATALHKPRNLRVIIK